MYFAKREGRDRIVAAQATDAGAGPPVGADLQVQRDMPLLP